MKLIASLLLLLPIHATALETSGDISFQSQSFYRSGPNPKQQNQNLSASVTPEFKESWNNDRSIVTFRSFGRYDGSDNRRSHFDIRQLDWAISLEEWEFRVGISKVFWGVTESAHLVDVINQTDFVENFDGEQKLGQPMVSASWVKDFGTFDFFVLPFFRERTHPGEEGRIRFQVPVNKDAQYANSNEEWHTDFALRWSHTLGLFDIGVSHFYGTSREPIYVLDLANGAIIPRYTIMNQTGLDLQMTYESWLFKLEAISRNWQEKKDFVSVVTGFEYTLSNLSGSGADLGFILEYLKDSRDKTDALGFPEATTPFENDLFSGVRLALNDENDLQFLGGVIFDLESRSKFANVEFSRLFGNNYKLTIESRAFLDLDASEFISAFRSESYTQVELTYSY